jgi:hypothetical protein
MTLDEKTKVSLPVKAIYTLAICFAATTFWLAGIYAEAKELPKRVDAIENKLTIQRDMCKVLKRLQEINVPKRYHEEINCQ